jgi:chromatin modification-related protein YNG2
MDADGDEDGNEEDDNEDESLYCFCRKQSYGDVSTFPSPTYMYCY